MSETEIAFYDAHRDEYREKHFDKWLVIVGESLSGVFATPKATFMMHRPALDADVHQTYHQP